MTLFNIFSNNNFLSGDILFFSLFAGCARVIGYSFVSSYLNSVYLDKSVQTDVWEDYSYRQSQIAFES
jgi:hypothetical protein